MKAGFMDAPCLAEEQNTLLSERMTIGMLISISKQCPQCTKSSTAAPVWSITCVLTELSQAVMQEGPLTIIYDELDDTILLQHLQQIVCQRKTCMYVSGIAQNGSPPFARYEGVPAAGPDNPLSGKRSGCCAYPLHIGRALSLFMASCAVFIAAASTTAGSPAHLRLNVLKP